MCKAEVRILLTIDAMLLIIYYELIMAQSTIKVKNGAITLPKQLQKNWKGASVFMRFSTDTVVLKKVRPSSFWKTWQKMKPATKGITRKDIENAISWARRGKAKK